MTRQEVFDRVWEYFVECQAPASVELKTTSMVVDSASASATCRLRGPQGEKCGIGLFIPDDQYFKGLENGPVGDWRGSPSLINHLQNWFGWNFQETLGWDFLQSVQDCHDDAERCSREQGTRFTTEVEARLVDLAVRFDLKVPAFV